MKKILTVLILILLYSCSNSNDDNNNSSNSTFHPPAWIQGTWKDGLSIGYKFSSNDFCSIVSNLQTCNKQYLEQLKKSGATVSVDENISATDYEFSYTIEGQTLSFHFIKISATEIELVNPTQGQPNDSFIKQ